jgi:hypothetical protein
VGKCRVLHAIYHIDWCRKLKSRNLKGAKSQMNFTHYAMPIYAQDHVIYCKQMYDWHMKMHIYQEQLKVYHMEQAKHFQKLMGERVETAELSNSVVS